MQNTTTGGISPFYFLISRSTKMIQKEAIEGSELTLHNILIFTEYEIDLEILAYLILLCNSSPFFAYLILQRDCCLCHLAQNSLETFGSSRLTEAKEHTCTDTKQIYA